MGAITDAGNLFLSDFNTQGVASSGVKKPDKREGRAAFATVDTVVSSLLTGITAGASKAYAAKALMDADITPADGVLAVVYNDGAAANNGVYQKSGASGGGLWVNTQITLPSSFGSDVAEVLASIDVMASYAADAVNGASQAQTAASAAEAAETAAEAARDNVVAMSDTLVGLTALYKIYDTKADAAADLGNIPANAYVKVLVDESDAGYETLYKNVAGTLTLKLAAPPSIKSPLILSPLGGTADDWPNVAAALAANAYARDVKLSPGTYLCKSNARGGYGNIPSGARLIGGPGVQILCSLVSVGDQMQTPFLGFPVASGGATTATTADASEGAASVTVASLAIGAGGANVAVGNWLRIFDGGNSAVYAKVVGVNTGAKQIIINRALRRPYPAGTSVSVVASVPQDIFIHGDGMLVNGSCDSWVGITAAFNCHVDNIAFGPDSAGNGPTDVGVRMDIGSYKSSMRSLFIDNGGHGLSCASIEGAEEMDLECLSLHRSGPAGGNPSIGGLLCFNTRGSRVSTITAANCEKGLIVSGGTGTDYYGSRDNFFSAITALDSTSLGIDVLNGASFNRFVGCVVRRSGSVGLSVAQGINASEYTRQNHFIGCEFTDNALGGVNLQANSGGQGSKDTIFTDLVTRKNASIGLSALHTCKVNGWLSDDDAVGAMEVQADACVLNARWSSVIDGGWTGAVISGGAQLAINGLEHNYGGSGTKALFGNNNGTLAVSNVKKGTGSTPTYGYAEGAAQARLVLGPNVDLSAAITPFELAGGVMNRGTATLVGGTVTVANSLVNSQTRVRLTRKTAAGTTGQLAYSISAGVSFTISSTSPTDTSVVDWELV